VVIKSLKAEVPKVSNIDEAGKVDQGRGTLSRYPVVWLAASVAAKEEPADVMDDDSEAVRSDAWSIPSSPDSRSPTPLSFSLGATTT
jgi:hypothetical protein